MADRRSSAAPAWWLLATAAVLSAAIAVVPEPGPNVLSIIMVIAGIATLVLGIRWHRPDPAAGWWVLAAAATAGLGGTVTVIVRSGVPDPTLGTADTPLTIGPVATGLFIAAYVGTGVGLALVVRVRGEGSGLADLVDALMLVAAVFPLLWFLVLDPLLDRGEAFRQPGTVVLPVACVVMAGLVVKLLLAVGLRWSALWLLMATLALFATTVRGLLPVLVEDSAVPDWVVPLLWAAYPVSLGLAALHPAVATIGVARSRDQFSVPRLLLLGGLALAVPFVFIFEDLIAAHDRLRNQADAAAMVGPVVVVAVLLVARLAIAARVAQRRADELALQAYALDLAMLEQETLRQQLTYRALHDPLTGLANRVVLAERLEWTLTRRSGTGPHALLMFDLDGFKDINDTLGHQIGDELLIAAGHRVLALVPEGGMLARLGGDEFAALLEEVSPEHAHAWAERVLKAVRRPFTVEGRVLYQTTTVGLAMLDASDGQTTPSTALRNADLALYAAKAAGKDRVLQFRPEMVQARLTHSRLSAGMRRALVNDEFSLHYQPVVDLATGQVRAVEALLRWTPPDGSPVPPDDFIPVAEETGLINEIGVWVLWRACTQGRLWYESRGVAVAVNVSGRQLVDPDFAQQVRDALDAAGLPGEALIIEVTETSMIATATVERAVRQLDQLRQQGVRVAIDDFGTGYSSLSYLARLPVDILKIDSSFTRQGPQVAFGPDDWPFARAIMELGEGLRLTTVAEGIETAEQAEALRQLNCHLAQGYLYSKPVPAERIDRLLAMPELSADRSQAR